MKKAYLLIIPLLLFAGCGDPNNGDFPNLFGSISKLDPTTELNGGSADIKIRVYEPYSSSPIEGIHIDLDNGDDSADTIMTYFGLSADSTRSAYYNESEAYAMFSFVPAGRHLIKASHENYEAKNIFIVVRGGMGMETFDLHLLPKGYNDGGDDHNPNDDYENNDTFDNPYTLPDSGNTFNETFNAVIDTSEDVDIFKFYVNDYYNVYAELTNIPSGTDYAISLYKHDGGSHTYIRTESNYANGNDDEYFSEYINYTEGDWYYLKVFSWNGSYSTNDQYDLNIQVY